jgi:putative ABC transport system ATP-binding protein
MHMPHEKPVNGEAVLRLCNVTKTFTSGQVETRVLRGIDLDIRTGELLVILGASGSGKTTLLNVAAGMMRPTGGEVWFGDTDLARLNDAELTVFRRHELGFVFQLYNLVPTLTAVENVRVATQIAENPLSAIEALDLVGLAGHAHQFPSQLSGGEQQRVAIARAIAKCPRVLFCDEPTGALDLKTGRIVLETIKRFNAESGTTVVIITHNAAISQMADRIVRLGSGVISSIEEQDAPVAVERIAW